MAGLVPKVYPHWRTKTADEIQEDLVKKCANVMLRSYQFKL